MPPRWPRQPDRRDPAYRRLDDRMTFATHVAIFAASNSGLWFFRFLDVLSPTPLGFQLFWLTAAWAGGLGIHAIYVFLVADYTK